jgi:hypothetical protein
MPTPSKREAQLASYRRELFGESDCEFYAPSEWHADPDYAMATIFKAACICLGLIVLLAVIGVLCAPAKGAELSPSTCQVIATNADTISYGSGVYVGDSKVLTCYHVVEDCPRKSPINLIARFPLSSKKAYRAKRVLFHPESDLALITLTEPVDVPWRTVDWHELKTSENVFNSGFGNRQQPPREGWAEVLTAIAECSHDIPTNKARTVMCVGKTREGDSGGPLCDERGLLRGIVWGGSDEWVMATPLSAERYWLEELLPSQQFSILVKP